MKPLQIFPLVSALLVAGSASASLADSETVLPKLLPRVAENSAPLAAPAPAAPGEAVSGQGFWKFAAARDLMPVNFLTEHQRTNAHGTLIVDPATKNVFWGLQGVGWIGFSNSLKNSWLVNGDPVFAKGNLHGADIFPRRGKPALVAAADNVSGAVYLTDTTFQHAEVLGFPTGGPYATNHSFRPTDVAFTSENELWIADGYARERLIPADVSPLRYRGEFLAGKQFTKTLHGVTFDAGRNSLWLACRPEEQLRRFDLARKRVVEILALPPGSTVDDCDLWGDYAFVPCLEGPRPGAGVIYIINLKKRTIVSTIRPKDDLGYADCLHMHDVVFYVTGSGSKQEAYIVFTNWHPGGIGALKLVRAAD